MIVLGTFDAFSNGIPSGFPFHDLSVTVSGFEVSPGTNSNTIRNAMFQAIMKLAAEAQPVVLEPVMSVCDKGACKELKSLDINSS